MDTVKIASILAFIAGLALIGGIALVLLTPQTIISTSPETERPTPTVRIVVVATEQNGKFLFGFEGQEPTTPAPEIRVKVGDIVEIILQNKGKIPHSLAITPEKRFDVQPLFNAAIGSVSRPLSPDEQASVVFKPNRPGEYYYVCQVPGHIELGMWGKLIAEE